MHTVSTSFHQGNSRAVIALRDFHLFHVHFPSHFRFPFPLFAGLQSPYSCQALKHQRRQQCRFIRATSGTI
ncbi:MAG TPA: hypothetical protein VGR64_11580, partial [Terracidiphilus sp.]|nr:hypothetical protein [Terracidiphilus sp.]